MRRAVFTCLLLLVPQMLLAQAPLQRIAFGSCADQDKPCPIWAEIGKARPDLLILLGDTIYADLDRSVKVTPEVIKSKYDILNNNKDFQAIRRSTKILATWDDHDYGKNDAGKDFPLKDASQQIFLDFFEVPKDSPRRTRKGVYHAEVFGPPGKRVQVILLDGRYHKTEIVRGKFDPKTRVVPSLPSKDPEATFLGEEQWKWFEEQLKVPADLRLIGSGIQVLCDDHPFEKWALIPQERERFFKLLRDTQANGVVILSGDRHLGEFSVAMDAISYPLYDLTSSGFNQANDAWRAPEKNRYRLAAMPFGQNFGFIQIDWTSERSPKISLELRDEKGEVAIRHPIRLGLLTPQKVVIAKPVPAGVLGAADARVSVGKEITVQFLVRSSSLTGDKKRLFLNSETFFRDEKNFTIVMSTKSREGKYKTATGETFKDKTVRVKGKVTEYSGRPQIEVDDETQIVIVE